MFDCVGFVEVIDIVIDCVVVPVVTDGVTCCDGFEEV